METVRGREVRGWVGMGWGPEVWMRGRVGKDWLERKLAVTGRGLVAMLRGLVERGWVKEHEAGKDLVQEAMQRGRGAKGWVGTQLVVTGTGLQVLMRRWEARGRLGRAQAEMG